MKKKLILLLIPLVLSGLTGCVKYNGRGKDRGRNSSQAETSSVIPDQSQPTGSSSQSGQSSKPDVKPSSDELPVGTEVKVYLVFGSYGLYKNNPVNTNIEALFLEHAIELDAKVGDHLPTRDDVTSTVEGSKFVAWTSYNNDGKLTEYTKVPGKDKKILYASYSGGNGGTPGSSQGGGGGGGTPIIPTNITYTVTNLPDWIQADGCVIFAWVWGSQDAGSWKSLTYGTNHDASFTVTGELQGFLLARCVSGTTTPDWNMTSGNDAGRVYNKTNDITCNAGVYSYACADWVGYPA